VLDSAIARSVNNTPVKNPIRTRTKKKTRHRDGGRRPIGIAYCIALELSVPSPTIDNTKFTSDRPWNPAWSTVDESGDNDFGSGNLLDQ
jgi:hypothetical protein